MQTSENLPSILESIPSARRARSAAGWSTSCGRHHPLKTADAVAAETAIAASTVAKWLDGSIVPGGVSLLRLIATYGPEFLCAVMGQSPDWLTAAAPARGRRSSRPSTPGWHGEIARLQRVTATFEGHG